MRRDFDPAFNDDELLVYEIDARGILTRVSRNWDQFALENGTPEMRAAWQLGRPFEGFFGDSETVETQRRVTRRCAARGQRATLLFRPHSPVETRLLLLWVDALDDGGFRFTSRVIDAAAMGESVYSRMSRVVNRPRVTRCGQCQRYRLPGSWIEVSPRAPEGAGIHRQPVVHHTLCSECRDAERERPRLVV